MTGSPPVLLQRAAELIEQRAAEATPGPWRDLPMGSDGSVVLAGGFTISTARRPARCGEFADATWIAMADPLWAAPLVAWLRTAAAASEQYGNVPKALMQDGGVAPAYRFTHQFVQAALDFALLILGEPRKD